MFTNDSEIAEAWIRYHEKGKANGDNPDFKAWELLNNYVSEDPARALKIMDKIVAGTDNQLILSNLGAGPLEDFLNSDQGPDSLQNIIDRARKDKNWRFAFGCVWTSGFKNKQLAEQIETSITTFFPNGRP